MKQLYTKWGRALDKENILCEYPRPLLVRKDYTNLNGVWEYAFTKDYRRPERFDGEILVPFSPESALSGVGRQLMPEEYLWYRRSFALEGWGERKEGRRLILHFGAVDQSCVVFVNGKRTAAHTGGYLPFETEITEFVREGENELLVAVKDLSDTSYHARGKQKLKSGGMFYTAQSGIWQTVWMEEVPKDHIRRIEAVPDLKKGTVRISVESESDCPVEIRIRRPALSSEITEGAGDETEPEAINAVEGNSNSVIEAEIADPALWTCEEPWLYFFTVRMGEDSVESYFAMRSFSVEKDEKGIPRICLNGKVQFQNGVLDQGYWSDGLYTAPSDEAMIFDIREMKKTGFNMVRKHVKIEPQRWYYHCDRLGMVVWQDMVNGGGEYKSWLVTYAATVLSWRNIHIKDRHTGLLSRREKAGKLEFVKEMKETVRLLKGHPSIAVWVIFNEGWGQFQTEDLTKIGRKLDPSRIIDAASGWFDQGGGDLQSVHNYFFKLKVRPEKERAAVLSEIGGYTFREEGHTACGELYGYKDHRSRKELNESFRELMKKVEALIPKGLCASVYTQWSDIEEEVNGIYTYDREVKKISVEPNLGTGQKKLSE
ncbi:glycoside hydrolase family 2 [Mediterraneibacter glycyrrhizinilyticus]|nr:sugar-binding domain-containing protein [Mediterraneibacter glycyrrhizinilyticus]MBM6855275.1 glycoside hydrolase family 2 [Mediterraneibacter glycyrrhizinilyticus]